jgi:peptidoglycan-associated lipoprotein
MTQKTSNVHRLATVGFALIGAVVFAAASGCSSNPPPAATSPQAAGAQTTAKAPGTNAPTSASSKTASSIHIDQAILSACGIPEPKAHFAFDSANIRPEDAEPLDLVVKCFTTGPLKGKSLKLVGHADPRGETEYNFVLGASRADAIGGYLSSKGLDKAKIATTSRGEMDATGTDEPGWARDRRVDVLLAK